MGFGNVASHLILFIALLSVTTTVAILFKGYITESGAALRVRQDLMASNLKTDITITNVNYNTTHNYTTITILNSGKTKLTVNLTDVFIDGLRYLRNTTARNLSVLNDTELVNPGIWDPDESAQAIVYDHIGAGTHTVTVTTQYGGKDLDSFSIA